MALLTPDSKLTELQNNNNWTELMVLNEELKTMPFGEVWDEYCRRSNTLMDGQWFKIVKDYENEVLVKRG